MLDIKTVSVIGANGTMGAAVSGLIAAFGNAKVYMIARRMEAAEKAAGVAADSVKAGSVRNRLIPKTYDDFEVCISESDWVFESVAENIAVKSDIYKRIQACKKPGLIVTTGTSGFSINELSNIFDEAGQKRYFGTHFFNPPYNLTLCEVIRSKKTDAQLFDDMSAYLKVMLCRDVIETTDTPAFLGNRIGFHFMNKALQYAEKYKAEGGIDYIDAVLGPFTGRGMTPIATIDFVGLDVHKAIVDNIQQNSNDYDNGAFVLPAFVNGLITEGRMGMKTNDGLFKTVIGEDKSKQRMVYDIALGTLRPLRKYDLPFAKKMVNAMKTGNYQEAFEVLKRDTSKEAMLCKFFVVTYITYSLVTAQSVSPVVSDADIAMSKGFNWAGPVALMQALGGYDEVLKIAKQADMEGNLAAELEGIDGKNKRPVPAFDYRKYFRANL
ncbi:MAG: 3-hydroxyacyl-CoA dehydrogenase family protein [Eubacteriales bacterium]|nr:3-hydroxyacyl-CoA dehydrogenase family protein [Eubacteriales bacterium]